MSARRAHAALVWASIILLARHARGDDGDGCRVVRDGARVELRSPFFTFHLSAGAGVVAEAWDNRQNGEHLSLGDGPELGVDLGELGGPLQSPSWQVTAIPASSDDAAECEAAFRLAGEPMSVTALVTYRWNSREPVLRKSVRIENVSGHEIRLLNVRLGTYPTPAKLAEREQGFPVYIGDGFFMSLAHPAGWASGKDGEVSLRQYPGAHLAPGATFDCMETVYGVGAAGTARAAFVEHVRGRMRRVVRGHDRPYAIYDNFGSWPSGEFINSEAKELHSLELLAASQKATGCRFDLCNIHFWVDSKGDMKRWDPERFPNGIGKIKPILDLLGTAPGLWIGSAVTWGDSWSIGPSPLAKASLTEDPAWFCRASEPIKSMFRDAFLSHVREEGVRLLKFDVFNAVCNNPAHGHLPGVYSTEAIDNAVIEFLHDLDRACPELFVILYWGYRSPWWLLHGDTLFDSGLDIEAATPSSQPSPYARDSVTQKLDQAQWYAGDVPALGKDSLGIWLSNWGWNSSIGKERWQEGFVMDLCRGSMLAQIWADNDWLSAPEWGQLADLIALLRARPECFGNPRFILGSPWNNEPYGYCCTDGRRAFLAINNCSWRDQVVTLNLDESWGLKGASAWDLYRWYPEPARLRGESEHFGSNVQLRMRPFEVALLEVVRAGESPSIERTLPLKHLRAEFAEAAQNLPVSVRPAAERFDAGVWTVLTPREVGSRAGATLSVESDSSVFASGLNAVPDVYTLTADTDLSGITGVRLEVLDDPRLPGRGPGRVYNGNFALSEFRVGARPRGSNREPVSVVLRRPGTSYSQVSFGGWPIEAAIDQNPATGWSVDPREGQAHGAVFETEPPIGFEGGTTLSFAMEQNGPKDHTIGRFRLSVTTAKPPLVPPEPGDARRLVASTHVPATRSGGMLVVTAELGRSGTPAAFRDIGTYFTCAASMTGRPIECAPVLGKATYPSSWEAWRIGISASESERAVELAIGTSLPADVQCVFSAHFVPADPAP